MSFVVPQIPASPDLALGARAYGFMLGGQGYMVSPGLYSELIKDPHWSALPNVQHHFAGLLNVRGTIVPVFHLDSFINGNTPAPVAPYVLVIGTLAQAAALALNENPRQLI